MDADALRSLIDAGPVVADGGMGTSLIERGHPVDACLDAVNVISPGDVEAVHRGFIAAGARLVLTNTFGANRYRLERHGWAARVDELCAAAVRLARSAGAPVVGGSMGPLGVRLAPYGRVRPDDAFEAYREQAAALVHAGVDLLVIETQSDLREVQEAVRAARDAAPETALIASVTFTRDDRTLLGDEPETVAARLASLGVDAMGANCGEGPAQVLRVLRTMARAAEGVPLVARPNAGGPTEVGGRFVYPATPDYFARVARAFADEGYAVIGGCCGTGPAHTAAIVEHAVRDGAPRPRLELPGRPRDDAEPESPGPTVTHLETTLARRRFAVAVEMEPPRSSNAAALVAAAGTLRDAGADVIDVADSPMAKMRMSAWAACRLIQERVDAETVLHFPTRGRNLLRLQGDLLGAHALGIRNLFVCVGDPVSVGEYPHGSDNIDVTATGLLALVANGFNAGVDRAGSSIGEATTFFAGAALAPSASDLKREARLVRKKVESGARFFLSQPVYAVQTLRALLAAYEEIAGEPLQVPVLAGVLLPVSARHAEFLHNEVPGIDIPEAVRARLAAAPEGEPAWRESVAMTTELIAALVEEGAAGIYLMPQFGRYDRAAEVVEAARRAGDAG
jgi:methionine synthase I (cobalamin-dependent)/5,10-methylenetetrahydrofolate reductase